MPQRVGLTVPLVRVWMWTIPLTIVVAYFVIGGEGIAHYVEEPFGVHEDHLDLERICHAIDRSVSEVLCGGP